MLPPSLVKVLPLVISTHITILPITLVIIAQATAPHAMLARIGLMFTATAAIQKHGLMLRLSLVMGFLFVIPTHITTSLIILVINALKIVQHVKHHLIGFPSSVRIVILLLGLMLLPMNVMLFLHAIMVHITTSQTILATVALPIVLNVIPLLIGPLCYAKFVSQVFGWMHQFSHAISFLLVLRAHITISPITHAITAQIIALLAMQVLIGLLFFVIVVPLPLGIMLLLKLAMASLFVTPFFIII